MSCYNKNYLLKEHTHVKKLKQCKLLKILSVAHSEKKKHTSLGNFIAKEFINIDKYKNMSVS